MSIVYFVKKLTHCIRNVDYDYKYAQVVKMSISVIQVFYVSKDVRLILSSWL